MPSEMSRVSSSDFQWKIYIQFSGLTREVVKADTKIVKIILLYNISDPPLTIVTGNNCLTYQAGVLQEPLTELS